MGKVVDLRHSYESLTLWGSDKGAKGSTRLSQEQNEDSAFRGLLAKLHLLRNPCRVKSCQSNESISAKELLRDVEMI